MKQETTPSKVTDKIMKLCEGISADTEPIYLPVSVPKWSLPSECFLNVQRMVRDHGGQQVNGWAIWQWANILVEAEAHAVWESPEGHLIDITPHDNEEKEILFLRDSSMMYSGQHIGNMRIALTNSPLAAELIALSEQTEAVMREYKPGTEIPIIEMQRRLAPTMARRKEIIDILYQNVSGNEFCPCGSGLKYKKCCGRD